MTSIVDYTENDLLPGHYRREIRELSKEGFMLEFASGTLKKSARLGFDVQDAYLQERAQLEYGAGFEVVPGSRVTYSSIKLTPCAALTELGWHAERMIELRPFDSDVFQCRYFEIEYADGKVKEGAGILVQETSAKWLPAGSMVLAVVAERVNSEYSAAKNPF